MGDKRKAESVADAAVVKTKRSKKSKVDKKPKKESRQRTDKGETAPVAQDDAKAIGDEGRKSSTEDLDRSHTAETASSLKKSTKTKKAKKATSRTSDQEDESHSSADAGASSQTQGEEGAASKGKPARFIVFVGNLPFGTTQEQVQEHFAKIKPSQVRLATEKDSKKSRGFAFVEFDHYDRMKTCLKLYHHSLMDDGKGNSRKINCELSAGGGGKSEYRKQKIQYKNEKLAAQRAQAAKLEKITKKKQEKRRQMEGQTQQDDDNSGIHPSRRSRVPDA